MSICHGGCCSVSPPGSARRSVMEGVVVFLLHAVHVDLSWRVLEVLFLLQAVHVNLSWRVLEVVFLLQDVTSNRCTLGQPLDKSFTLY